MDAQSKLLVPYGVPESGPPVPVAVAARGTRYTCPGCAAVLVLRDSETHRRRKHFSHPAHGSCSQESIYHATAKRIIAEVIREHAAGKHAELALRMKCGGCANFFNFRIAPGTFTGAAEEYSIDGFRCDVVGLNGSDVQLAIEILHTHATTDAKAAGLSARMIELQAFDVLSDPYLWAPVRNTLNPHYCNGCWPRIAAPAPKPSPAKPPRYGLRPAALPVDVLERLLRGGGRRFRRRNPRF